jgi:N-acetyl-anhydromuramyl-L-alanine amidase AmpD
MRDIRTIVLHCSATKAGQRVTVADIDSWHKQRGFKKIGYHYVIYESGEIATGRELTEVGAHVEGHNTESIGICYTGGLDAGTGKPADTRTESQKKAIRELLQTLKMQFPKATICGHRDFSKDTNGNGIIDPNERLKECPCFDAKIEYKDI